MATKQITTIPLGLNRIDMGRETTAHLLLETSKDLYGGIHSTATVKWMGNGFYTHSFAFGAGGGDFRKTLIADKSARATQRAIDTLHARTFTPAAVTEITASALAHYPGDAA
jgi:hypothetical protein